MKNIYKSFGIIVLTAIIGFSLAGCNNGTTDDNPPAGDPALGGTPRISDTSGGAAITAAYTDSYLYAVYDGIESGITYQWNKDGSPVSTGGTDASILAAAAGGYTVTVSAAGYTSKTSAKVTVTVPAEPQLGALHISDTPTGTAVTAADTPVTLYAVYTPVDDETVSYQWKEGGNSITGGTENSYKAITAGDYTVTISAAEFADKTSAKVTVSLSSLEGALHISDESEGAVVATAAAPVTLFAVYGGGETVTYQWNKNGSSIDSATSVSYNAATAGSYTVTISAEGYESKTSAPPVTVSPPPLGGALHISTSEDGAAVSAAETIDTLYAVYGGDETVTYRWNKNGSPLDGDGATSSSYKPTTAGEYTVTLSAEGYADITSAKVTVTLSPLEGELSIATKDDYDNYTSVTEATTNDTLWADYDGDEAETYQYQWKKAGSDTPVGTEESFKPITAGDYTVTISAVGYEPKTSSPVTVTIATLKSTVYISDEEDPPPMMIVTEVWTGDTLYAIYRGSEDVTLSYQWNKDGTPIPGATRNYFQIDGADGVYSVTVSAEGYEPKTSATVTAFTETTVTITGLTQSYWGDSITLTIYDDENYPDDYFAEAEATVGDFDDEVTFTTTWNNSPVFVKGEYCIRIIHHAGSTTDWVYLYSDNDDSFYNFKGVNIISIDKFPGAVTE